MEIINNLTVFQVAVLRDKLLEKIAVEKKIVIDLQELQECDVAGLQLLVSLTKTANAAGKELQLNNAPDCFLKTVTAVGLDHCFGHLRSHDLELSGLKDDQGLQVL